MPADIWTARDSQRALRRRLARSTDPADWLVLADLLEEAGEDAEAHRWRRRGEWWPELHAVLWVAVVARRNRTFGAVAGPFFVRYRRCKESVLVELFWDRPHPAGQEKTPVMISEGCEWSSYWFLPHDGTTTDKVRKKLDRNLRNVIDYLARKEAEQ